MAGSSLLFLIVVLTLLVCLEAFSRFASPSHKVWADVSASTTALFNAPARVPNKRDKRIEAVLEKVQYSRTQEAPRSPLAEDPLMPQIETIVRAADSRKASSISVFRVHHLTEQTTFMVLIEGNSKPQNQAIANAVVDDLVEEHKESPYSKEGTATSGWILLDYASIIVHIMTPQMNNFYKLEKRWKDAEFMDVTYLLTPEGGSSTYNAADDAEFQDRYGMEEDEDEDSGIDDGEEGDAKLPSIGEVDTEDPFWS